LPKDIFETIYFPPPLNSFTEMLRQETIMQRVQHQELESIELSQQQQFLEFSAAWDSYMQDYEAAAFRSLEQLKEKHDREVVQMREFLSHEYPGKYTLSKELMELRRNEKLAF